MLKILAVRIHDSARLSNILLLHDEIFEPLSCREAKKMCFCEIGVVYVFSGMAYFDGGVG